MADQLNAESLSLSSDTNLSQTHSSGINAIMQGFPAIGTPDISEDGSMSDIKAIISNGSLKNDHYSLSEVDEEQKDCESNGKNGSAAGIAKTPKAPRTPRGKGKATEEKLKKTPAKKRVPSNVVQGDRESDPDYDVAAEKPKGHKKRVSINLPLSELGDPSTPPTKKRRTPANTPVSGRAIPESREDLDENDRMLLEMREAGKGWPEIRKAFEEKGIKTGASTLPNRYSRLTAKLTTWKTGDEDIFLEVKATVEADILKETNALVSKLEIEKWTRISEAIVGKGGDKYTSAALQKKAKDLSKALQTLSEDVTASGIPPRATLTGCAVPIKFNNGEDIIQDCKEEK